MEKLKNILQKLDFDSSKIENVSKAIDNLPSNVFIYPANFSTNLQIDVDKTNLLLLLLCKEKKLSVFTVPFLDENFFEDFAEEGILEIEDFENISDLSADPDLDGRSLDDLDFATAYKVSAE